MADLAADDLFGPEWRPREARAADLKVIADVEESGLPLYVDALGDRMVPALGGSAPSGADRLDRAGFLLVVGRPVVGFAHVVVLDDHAHLDQLSVRPEVGRRGLGTALVRAAARDARRDGFRDLSLCTYRDLAWNAPFYAGLGFVEVPSSELLPYQRELRAHEVALGLDGAGPRLVMSLRLR